MSKLKVEELKIKSITDNPNEFKISDFELEQMPKIKEFNIQEFKVSGENDYAAIETKYGPLASTHFNSSNKLQHDSRFSLNPLLREPLSIEQEEKRVIDEKVRVAVEALSEEVRVKAEAIGYQAGLKKGHDEAYKKFEEEGVDRMEHFDALVAEMVNAKIDVFRANEQFLIELIFRIAKMVILRELSTDRDYLVRLAKELITRSGARDHIIIKINSEDADTLEALKSGVMKSFGQLNNLNIETSKLVKRGGCKVETEWNQIDTSVEKQLEAINLALTGRQTMGGAN